MLLARVTSPSLPPECCGDLLAANDLCFQPTISVCEVSLTAWVPLHGRPASRYLQVHLHDEALQSAHAVYRELLRQLHEHEQMLASSSGNPAAGWLYECLGDPNC